MGCGIAAEKDDHKLQEIAREGIRGEIRLSDFCTGSYFREGMGYKCRNRNRIRNM